MDGSSRSLVEIANKHISIWEVCRLVGVDFGGYYGTNSKLYCPFGNITHMDGGSTKAFRVYPATETAYCFGCSQFFDAVGLYSEFSDLSREEAADFLLTESGWKEETYEEKWDKLTKKTSIDTSGLSEALDIYCLKLNPEWEVICIESPYREAYASVMGVLPYVRNFSDADKWMNAAKEKMRKVLTNE